MSGTAVGLTAANLIGPVKTVAQVQVLGANIRTKFKSNPTTSSGVEILSGQSFVIYGPNNLANLRMIAESGTATVFVQYGRQ